MSTFIRLKQHNREHFDDYLYRLSRKLKAFEQCRVSAPYHNTHYWIKSYNVWQQLQDAALVRLIKTTPE